MTEPMTTQKRWRCDSCQRVEQSKLERGHWGRGQTAGICNGIVTCEQRQVTEWTAAE